MATCVALAAPHSESSCSVELSATHHAESPARKPAPRRVNALGTPTTASMPRSHSVGLNRAVSMPRIPTTATAKLGCSNHGSEPNLWQRLQAGNPCTGVPTNEGDTTRPAIPTPSHHSLLGPNTAVAFIIDPSTAVDTDTSYGVSHPHPHGPAGTNRVASLPEAPTTDTWKVFGSPATARNTRPASARTGTLDTKPRRYKDTAGKACHVLAPSGNVNM